MSAPVVLTLAAVLVAVCAIAAYLIALAALLRRMSRDFDAIGRGLGHPPAPEESLAPVLDELGTRLESLRATIAAVAEHGMRDGEGRGSAQ